MEQNNKNREDHLYYHSGKEIKMTLLKQFCSIFYHSESVVCPTYVDYVVEGY